MPPRRWLNCGKCFQVLVGNRFQRAQFYPENETVLRAASRHNLSGLMQGRFFLWICSFAPGNECSAQQDQQYENDRNRCHHSPRSRIARNHKEKRVLDLTWIFRVGFAHRHVGVLGRIRGLLDRKWFWPGWNGRATFDTICIRLHNPSDARSGNTEAIEYAPVTRR